MSHLIFSREFARDPGKAEQAEKKGPALITTRDKPDFALLGDHDFEQLGLDAAPERSLWRALSERPSADDGRAAAAEGGPAGLPRRRLRCIHASVQLLID